MSSQPLSRSQEALIMGFVWATVGLIYSAIFVAMLAFFRQFEIGPLAAGLAASLAGAVGALFYGSLRLAFLSTVAALIASFGYLAFLPTQTISPLEMLGVSGLAGVIVGGHYGQFMKESRVCQATREDPGRHLFRLPGRYPPGGPDRLGGGAGYRPDGRGSDPVDRCRLRARRGKDRPFPA
jgi:hypothetical protein